MWGKIRGGAHWGKIKEGPFLAITIIFFQMNVQGRCALPVHKVRFASSLDHVVITRRRRIHGSVSMHEFLVEAHEMDSLHLSLRTRVVSRSGEELSGWNVSVNILGGSGLQQGLLVAQGSWKSTSFPSLLQFLVGHRIAAHTGDEEVEGLLLSFEELPHQFTPEKINSTEDKTKSWCLVMVVQQNIIVRIIVRDETQLRIVDESKQQQFEHFASLISLGLNASGAWRITLSTTNSVETKNEDVFIECTYRVPTRLCNLLKHEWLESSKQLASQMVFSNPLAESWRNVEVTVGGDDEHSALVVKNVDLLPHHLTTIQLPSIELKSKEWHTPSGRTLQLTNPSDRAVPGGQFWYSH